MDSIQIEQASPSDKQPETYMDASSSEARAVPSAVHLVAPSDSSDAIDSRQGATVISPQPVYADVDEKTQLNSFTWDCCFVFAVGASEKKLKVRVSTIQKLDEKEHDKGERVEMDEVSHFRNTTAEVIERLRNAGLETDLWYSVQRDEIYVRIGATEKRLMTEAARIQHDLALDPTQTRLLAEQNNMALAAACKGQKGQTRIDDKIWENLFGRYDEPNTDGQDLWRQKIYRRYPDKNRLNELRPLLVPAQQQYENLRAEHQRKQDAAERDAKAKNSPTIPIVSKSSAYATAEREYLEIRNEIEYLEEEQKMRPDSRFSSIDRIKLVVSIIEADVKQGGAGISCSKLIKKHKHSMIAFFALHEPKKRDVLVSKWLRWKSTFDSPLDRIRDYFGEKVALYFAFLQFYNMALVAPTVLGLAFFLYQIGESRVDVSGMPAYAIFIAMWATLFLEGWKRKEAEYRVKWGTSKFASKEQTRPEFKGDWEPSPITGQLIEVFPWIKRLIRALMSQTVIWTLIVVVIAAVVGVFFIRKVMQENHVSQAAGTYISAVINAVQIQILNIVYGKVAIFMNDFENHRTDSDYENALIAKNFLFKFINSYNSLFYVAFFKKYDDTVQGCVGGDCLRELQQQLAAIFISLIVINNTVEVLIPYIKSRLAERANTMGTDGQVLTKKRSDPELEYELAPYESTFDDFDELVVQFGFVTLFVTAFPITPLLALANNVIETRIDSTKLCMLTRRPEPRGAYDIGTWSAIINIVSFIAVITNTAIVCFETKRLDDWVNGNDTTKFQVFIIAEHLIMLVKFAIAYFVPDEPQEVAEHIARQEHIVNVLINGADDVEESDDVARGDGDAITKQFDDFDWSIVAEEIRPSGHEFQSLKL